MLGGVLLIRELTSGLNHDLDAKRVPVQLTRIFRGKNLDALSVYDDGVAVRLHLTGKSAESRVILQEMRQRLRVRKIVGRDKFNVRTIHGRANDIAADPSESV